MIGRYQNPTRSGRVSCLYTDRACKWACDDTMHSTIQNNETSTMRHEQDRRGVQKVSLAMETFVRWKGKGGSPHRSDSDEGAEMEGGGCRRGVCINGGLQQRWMCRAHSSVRRVNLMTDTSIVTAVPWDSSDDLAEWPVSRRSVGR